MLERASPAPDETVETMNRRAGAYVEAFRRNGVANLVSNLVTRVELRSIGDRDIPVTINDVEPTGTYVCSPHTAYARYAREELRTLPSRWLDRPLSMLIGGMGRWLRAAEVDRVVHLNNWMVSTNLSGGLTIPDAAGLTRNLAAEFPNHFLAVRSLNAWSDAALMGDLTAAGWLLVPSRQVWIVDDPARDWAHKHNAVLDRALGRKQRFAREDFATMSEADAAAVSRLYGQLYLDKYSRLNPAYTPAFIRATHAIGAIRYIGFRDRADGRLVGVVGYFRLGDTATSPIVGYDTQLPTKLGLYRLAIQAFMEEACHLGLRINLSSGAAAFKRHRGARPEIEYSACYLSHLQKSRQRPIRLLAALLTRIGVPLMRKYQL